MHRKIRPVISHAQTVHTTTDAALTDGDDGDMALGGSNNTDGGHLAASLPRRRVLDLDLKPCIHAESSGFTSSEEKGGEENNSGRTD